MFPRFGPSSLMLVALVCVSAQETGRISNTNHRPLVGALDQLRAMLGVPIHYEDARYENAVDLEDVATPRERALDPSFHQMVPRKGTVSANFVGRPGLITLQLLLDSYRDVMLPGDFRFEEAKGAIYVTPRRFSEFMKTPISIPHSVWEPIEAEGAILEAISKASGQRIVAGSFPFTPPGSKIAFGADQEAGRDVLARLHAKLSKQPVAYRMLFDSKFKYYMLNVDFIAKAETAR